VLAAIVSAATGVVALIVLLGEAELASAQDQPALRIDAIKTSLAVIAGTGGAAALILSFRKQWLAERAQSHTEEDAAERRVIDLFTRAVEQLGSSQAAIRLGALYSLERVAQGNEDLRQTIVDVICAYLRMPFLPSTQETTAGEMDHDSAGGSQTKSSNTYDPEERQVRATAQRILRDHLALPFKDHPQQLAQYDPERERLRWRNIDIDLRGALLIEFSLGWCEVRQALFDGATFDGDMTTFGNSFFRGRVSLVGCKFTGAAYFAASEFEDEVDMSRMTIESGGHFYGCTFREDVTFERMTVRKHAGFEGSVFEQGTYFGWVKFRKNVSFATTTFRKDAYFLSARFGGVANFDKASMDPATVNFDRAKLARSSSHESILPLGWVAADRKPTGRWLELVRRPPDGALPRQSGESDGIAIEESIK